MRMITERPGAGLGGDGAGLCLDCRARAACPSGVHYGQIIEPFRLAMEEEKHQGIRMGRFRGWSCSACSLRRIACGEPSANCSEAGPL